MGGRGWGLGAGVTDFTGGWLASDNPRDQERVASLQSCTSIVMAMVAVAPDPAHLGHPQPASHSTPRPTAHPPPPAPPPPHPRPAQQLQRAPTPLHHSRAHVQSPKAPRQQRQAAQRAAPRAPVGVWAPGAAAVHRQRVRRPPGATRTARAAAAGGCGRRRRRGLRLGGWHPERGARRQLVRRAGGWKGGGR